MPFFKGDFMNQVPEVQAVLSALTDYIRGWVAAVVLAALPILGILYGSAFFLWWRRRNKK